MTSAALCAAVASSALGLWHSPPVAGASRDVPTNAYVALPGPWQYRWVAVRGAPRGTPSRVRERSGGVRYVTTSPLP